MGKEIPEGLLEIGDTLEEKGMYKMWHNAMAREVLILLDERGEVTKDTLHDILVERIQSADNRMLAAAYKGALNALRGKIPKE